MDTPRPTVGRRFSVAAIVLGVLAVVLVPVLTGTAALVCGIEAARRNDRLAGFALTAAGVGMLAGIVVEGLFGA